MVGVKVGPDGSAGLRKPKVFARAKSRPAAGTYFFSSLLCADGSVISSAAEHPPPSQEEILGVVQDGGAQSGKWLPGGFSAQTGAVAAPERSQRISV